MTISNVGTIWYPGTALVTLSGTGVVINFGNQTVWNLNVPGNVTASNNSIFLSGTINVSGTLNLSSTGNLFLNNNSTMTLTGTVNGGGTGKIQLANNITLGAAGTLNAPIVLDSAISTIPARNYGRLVTLLNSATATLGTGSANFSGGVLLQAGASGSDVNVLDASVNNPTVTVTSITFATGGTAAPRVNAGSGNWTISGPLTLSTATFNANSASITFSSSVFLSSGAVFNANTSSITIQGNFTMDVASETFNAGTSTVTFVGVAGSTSTLSGSTTFYNLIVNTPAKWIDFQAGSTTTVTNLLNLTGTSGNLVGVRSTIPGQYSFLINTGTNTVTFVDAEDNNASGGLMIRAGASSHDSGNNVNWSFGENAPISPVITGVFVSSMSATWSDVNYNTGYSLEASTGASPNTFTGNVSSVTFNPNATGLAFNAAQLAPNTTYVVQVGALYNGDTVYLNTVPASTSTLTNLLQNAQVFATNTSSITVNWTQMSVGSGTNTSEGYRL